MATITVEFPHKTIVFTNWYQNTSYSWLRASTTLDYVTVFESFSNPGFYQAKFRGDEKKEEMEILNKLYDEFYKGNHLKNVHDTQDRVDDFLINKFPKIKNLLAFL